MKRAWMMGGTVVFTLGTLAGASLLVMLLVDAEYGEAGRVALGTLALGAAARGFRLGWQRANQEREFRREPSSATGGEKEK
jgi:hypothetical protein